MKVDVKIPSIGESVNTAIIGSWEKSSGDLVRQDDILVLLETDKASMEVPSEHQGQLEILKQSGEEAQVGEVIARIDTSVAVPEKSKDEKPQSRASSNSVDASAPSAIAQPTSPAVDLASLAPSVRHAVLEKNIDPSNIQGTGKDGRIKKSDLLNSIKTTPAPKKSQEQKFQAVSSGEETRKERMTTIRKKIAERLVASQRGTATLTTFNEADMSKVIALRKEYQDIFVKKYGIKLGFMGFFVKAVIQALKAYPKMGAQIQGDELIYNNHCHISIAVSTERGLLVPVIRYAEQMSIVQIEKMILELAEKARTGQIRPDDLSGGTFTVSNGGIFGSLLSTPILNPPQSGILGMHKMEPRPVARNGEVVIRPMMYLALSYDHRVVDGKESVGFLVKVKECIEDPTRILIDI